MCSERTQRDAIPMQMPLIAPLLQSEVSAVLAAATADTTEMELVLTPWEVNDDCTDRQWMSVTTAQTDSECQR